MHKFHPGFLCLILLCNPVFSEFSGQGEGFVIQGGKIERSFFLSGDGFYTTGLRLEGSHEEFLEDSREFFFLMDGEERDGRMGWKIAAPEDFTSSDGGKGTRVELKDERDASGLVLTVHYVTYPELPVVRKWLHFENRGTKDLKIEGVHVEDLQSTLSHVHSIVLHDYARMKHLGAFTGGWHDPLVVVHHHSRRLGIALGNEAPGILKRTAYHSRNDNLEIGLTHPDQDFPFRKWLEPGDSWTTPASFICLYEGDDDPFAVVDGPVNDFVRRHLKPQIIRKEDKPLFVYNTWNPFRTFVSDSLVREVAKAAAECGVQEFIIDDGWQVNRDSRTSEDAWGNNYGDWLVDQEKFPGGFKPTFDYIRSLGMKPGIWMSLGSATKDAAVFREHPEWFVRNPHGELGNLHSEHDADFHTSCFGTGWVDYIEGVITSMCDSFGLAYTKLDFAIAASAYVNDPLISGCYATDHPFHRDREESYLVIYERLLELFDRLHAANPDLFIDCTFETAGKLQLMDYAIARHAEGNWLSNFEEPSPTGPLRIRHMAWWRSPALPAGSLVIGNSAMDDPDFEFALQSLIGTLPIVLGDPRKIPEDKRKEIRAWSLWMQEMQDHHDYMSFRRDLPGFGEPREGSWDGWMRLNNDSRSGGIVGVFRQGATESNRTVSLKGLDPDRNYQVNLAPGGEILLTALGSELMESGFQVKIPENYGGRIFEIRSY